MWRPRSSPIVPIIVAESDATGRVSIGVFQTLSAGKIGQSGAPANVGAPPVPVPPPDGVGVGVGVGVEVGEGVGRRRVGAFGWLENLRGSVCALYSGAVRPAVVVGVGDPRVRPDPLLSEIGQAVMIGTLVAVSDPVVIRIGVPRRGPGEEFERVPKPIVVGILTPVAEPVVVRVGAARVRSGQVFLPVRQPVVVGILAAIGDAVAVRVRRGTGWCATGSVPTCSGGRHDRSPTRRRPRPGRGDRRRAGAPARRATVGATDDGPCRNGAAAHRSNGMPRSSRTACPVVRFPTAPLRPLNLCAGATICSQ